MTEATVKVLCKQKVSSQWRHSLLCSRTAVRDGYCAQHHPDAKEERRKKANAEWQRKQEKWRLTNEKTTAATRILALALAHRDAMPEAMQEHLTIYVAASAALREMP